MLKQGLLLLKERFSLFLLSFLIPYTLVLPFAAGWLNRRPPGLPTGLGLAAVLLLQFTQLLVLDELADYPFDCRYHPQRPLVRGACSRPAAWLLVVLLILPQVLLCWGLYALPGLVVLVPAVYAFLIYKGFFLPRQNRRLIVEIIELVGDALFPVVQYLAVWSLVSSGAATGRVAAHWLVGLGIFLAFGSFGIFKHKKRQRMITDA